MNPENYEILRELGAGNLGRACLARDRQSGEEVVLKLAAPEDLLVEREALSLFAHEGIVKLLAAEPEFLVLERLEGETWDARIRAPQSPAEVIAVVTPLASALAHVHERGYVHRDVKPENVFLEENGRVVLADFGVATKIGTPNDRTPDLFTGTPLFASPEQLVAGAPLSGAVDVYALGVSVYYALSECIPYPVTDLASLSEAILQSPPVPLQNLVDAPARLVKLVMRMLAKAPADRPSAIEVVAAL